MEKKTEQEKRETQRLYRLNNKEKIYKCHKDCVKKNGEKYKEAKKLYCLKNKERDREKIKERGRLYRLNNKEKIAKRSKQYAILNKEKIKKYIQDNKERTKENKRVYQIKNREKISVKTKEYRRINKDKITAKIRSIEYKTKKNERYREYYKQNKEKILLESKEYRKANSERLKEKAKIYTKNSAEKRKIYKKDYYEKNKIRLLLEIKDYRRDRRKVSPLFKLQCNLRKRLWYAFKLIGKNKSMNTVGLLGADLPFIKNYIEKQFETWMNWDNYGREGWVIDHIIPLAFAETEDELKSLCHYTNLAPLGADENSLKRDKMDDTQIKSPLYVTILESRSMRI